MSTATTAPTVQAGTIVSHWKYGRGRVLGIGLRDQIAGVQFDADGGVARTVLLRDLRPEAARPVLRVVQ